eukprot:CAMPEP_0195065228 /NCGR_PEP_ID=MMETSP0448-20130528/10949_1 /TAXON_ID=66468 /ORGANISM="Heterocapsa triquestra, Strain CCMP 448" /LENGTH=103 /DNA_ID=CAMNT_0040096305 /DNA_START=338 /DNA_END=645 /DNA_ORIENTATION=+
MPRSAAASNGDGDDLIVAALSTSLAHSCARPTTYGPAGDLQRRLKPRSPLAHQRPSRGFAKRTPHRQAWSAPGPSAAPHRPGSCTPGTRPGRGRRGTASGASP